MAVMGRFGVPDGARCFFDGVIGNHAHDVDLLPAHESPWFAGSVVRTPTFYCSACRTAETQRAMWDAGSTPLRAARKEPARAGAE